MFRRRTLADRPADRSAERATGPVPLPGPRHAIGAVDASRLAAAGWVLPRGLAAEGDPRWTLVGTVGSPTATAVDEAGLVVGDGWSLDWWIGADDRWHLPTVEAAVRQALVGDAPVVETRLRIPGGDAVQRTYGIRSPRTEGDEWVIAEVENATPIPFAVALVVRPFVADAVGDVPTITVEKVRGGRGRDGAHLVRVAGTPAFVLPRLPARVAAGDLAAGDVVDRVRADETSAELVTAACPDGLATLAMVFPLPHTAILRVAIPVGEGAGVADGPAIDYPAVIPDAATVASGWEVHRRGLRLDLPDRRAAEAFARARSQVLLAHDGAVVRRDGRRSQPLVAGSTEVILAALDTLDRPGDVDAVVARWPDRLGVLQGEGPAGTPHRGSFTSGDTAPAPQVDALVLDALAWHWLRHRSQPVLDWVLPEVSGAIERIDRADRRRGLPDPVDRWRAARALDATAWMLETAGQPEAAVRVSKLAARVGVGGHSPAGHDQVPAVQLAAVAFADDPTDRSRHDRLFALLGDLSSTGAAPGPGPGVGLGARWIGHDLAASAATVLAVRSLLVSESRDGLALLPMHPDTWYGGGVELHDAPTAFGTLSFAVRWHDSRPALLWDLEPHAGQGAVRITIPGLDPGWSTTETRGDALLAEVPVPEGIDRLLVVADHPDIDPAMRRPGEAPVPDPVDRRIELPEGGTFS